MLLGGQVWRCPGLFDVDRDLLLLGLLLRLGIVSGIVSTIVGIRRWMNSGGPRRRAKTWVVIAFLQTVSTIGYATTEDFGAQGWLQIVAVAELAFMACQEVAGLRPAP